MIWWRKPQQPDPEPPIELLDRRDIGLNGTRAEALLSDPVLHAAFETVAARYRQQWENSSPGDHEAQVAAHAGLYALKQVQQQLRSYISTVKLTADRNRNPAAPLPRVR